MSVRRWQALAASAAVVALPVVATVLSGSPTPLATLPAAGVVAALAAFASNPTGRRHVGRATLGLAVASLVTTTVVAAANGIPARSLTGSATLVEAVGLLALLTLAVRRARPGLAATAAATATAAVALTVLRFESENGETARTVAGVAAWSFVAAVAAGVGLFLRAMDGRRALSVVEARRAQRLQLAADLHDFVAHDVSEMLAQAQAGRLLAEGHPSVADAFARIEEAALRSLRSMDETLEMLRDAALPPAAAGEDHHGRATLVDLPELARRFAAAHGADVRLQLGTGVTWDELRRLPHAVSATLYRVAVEALTNVGRHAPAASVVTIDIRRRIAPDANGTPSLELAVADDAGASPPPGGRGRRGGSGLPTLAERVEALGGRLAAGPRAPAGWELTVTVPSSEAELTRPQGWRR